MGLVGLVGLIVSPCKSVIWFPFSLPFGFFPLAIFCTLEGGIKVLKVPFDSFACASFFQ
jgi:hypothetical protein